LTHQVEAAAQEVTGGTHLGWLDRGLREHPTAQQRGNLLGITLVILSLTAVDCLHIQGVSEDKGNSFLGTEIGEPRPGKEAFDRHNQTVAVGSDSLEERFRGGVHMAVPQNVPVLVEDTSVQGPGMQVDAAVKWGLFGVESHEVSSSLARDFFPGQHTTGVG